MINIVTINYNNKIGLEKTLKSIQNAIEDAEIRYYIVDGGSTDGSLDLVEKYKNIIYTYISEKDNGIYNAMNKAIDLVDIGMVIFLNSGDVFSDDFKVKDLIHWIEHRGICPDEYMIYSDHFVALNNLKIIKKSDDVLHPEGSLPSHQAVLLPISFLKNNKFNERLNISADSYLLRTAIEELKCVKYEIPICVFSLGGVSNNWPSYSKFLQHAREYTYCNRVKKHRKVAYYIKGSIKYILLKTVGFERYYTLVMRFKGEL
ncbi:TPA: glycosyltransferase [Vibrio vulnificus]|nr:glycosyltransferase [Vibrio vulnificus]